MAIPLSNKNLVKASDFYTGTRALEAGTRLGQQRAAENKRKREQWAQEYKLQKEKADAQDKATQILEDRVTDKFYTTNTQDTQYNALNNIWDNASNSLIDVYHGVVSDKDMNARDKSIHAQKLLRQVPMLSNGRKILNDKIQQYATLAAQGDVSGTMDAKFQRMYADLLGGEFDGDIKFEGDTMILEGKTSQGDDIRMPLRDFGAHLPGITAKGMSLSEAMAGVNANWQKRNKEYKVSGDPSKKLTFDKNKIIEAAEETIANYEGDGDAIFAIDTMNLDPNIYEQRWRSKVGRPDPHGLVSTDLKDSILADPELIKKYAKEQNVSEEEYRKYLEGLYGQKPDVMTETEAKNAVTKELLQDYALAMEAQFDRMKYGDTIPYSGPLTEKQLAAAQFNSDLARQTTNWIGGIRDKESETILDGIKDASNAQIVLKEGKPVLLYDKLEKSALVNVDGEKQLQDFNRSIEVDLNDEDAIERIWKSKFMVGTAAQKDRAAKWWSNNRLKAIKSMKDMFEAEALKRNEDRLINAYQNARIFGGGPDLSPEERKKVLAKYKFQ